MLLGVTFLGEVPTAYAQTTSPVRGLDQTVFDHPNTGTPSAPTTTTPAGSENIFIIQMLRQTSDPQRKQVLQLYAGQIDQIVEKTFTDYGYEKNYLGVALAGLLETGWEIANGSFKLGTGDEQDKGEDSSHRSLDAKCAFRIARLQNDANKSKQLYEASNFMMGNLVMQWQAAGSDATKKAAVQQTARKQLQSLFGAGADSLTRKPDRSFVRVGSAESGGAVASTAGAKAKVTAAPPVAAATSSPLPAASVHGAQIFINYTFQATTTTFDHLILFPSGAAFTDIPSKPVSSFDEATLRAGLKPYDIGTRKQSGGTITLTFPNKKRDMVTKLRNVTRDSYDGDWWKRPEKK